MFTPNMSLWCLDKEQRVCYNYDMDETAILPARAGNVIVRRSE